MQTNIAYPLKSWYWSPQLHKFVRSQVHNRCFPD